MVFKLKPLFFFGFLNEPCLIKVVGILFWFDPALLTLFDKYSPILSELFWKILISVFCLGGGDKRVFLLQEQYYESESYYVKLYPPSHNPG